MPKAPESIESIRQRLRAGKYASAIYAVRAIKRTILPAPVKQMLLDDVESYYRGQLRKNKRLKVKNPAPVFAAAEDERAEHTSLDALEQELSELEARHAVLCKLIKAAQLRRLLETDPERVERALTLFAEHEAKHAALHPGHE